MKTKYFMKGVYYSLAYVAKEFENAAVVFVPPYSKERDLKEWKFAVSLRDNAKKNFELAFRKELSDRLR